MGARECESSAAADEADQLCSLCGKRKSAGRKGSLTQWIFKQESCQCDRAAMQEQFSLAGLNTSAPAALSNRGAYADKPLSSEPEAEQSFSLTEQEFPLSRYKPLALLGSGSSGAVYKCYDRQLKRLVAVKVLHVLSSDETVHFQNEARALAQLNRPGIVKILDFGITDGEYPFMVMAFEQGTSLTNYFKEVGVMNPDDTRYLAGRIADALAYAHKQGIYHRDVKPANVLVVASLDGFIKDVTLIDFGVAKFRKAEYDLDESPTIAGTPLYMSPDQAAGVEYDARSEVYSVGCLLYEALTGKPPFEADSALQLFNLHATVPPQAVSSIRRDIPPHTELELIIDKCLAKSPEDRFQSMDEFAAAIAEIEPSASCDQRVEVDRRTNVSGSLPTKSISKQRALIIVSLLTMAALAAYAAMNIAVGSRAKPPASAGVRLRGQQAALQTLDSMIDFAEDLQDKRNSRFPDHCIIENGHLSVSGKYASDSFLRTLKFPDKHLMQVSIDRGSISSAGLRLLCARHALKGLTILASPAVKQTDVCYLVRSNPGLNAVNLAGLALTPSIMDCFGKCVGLRVLALKDISLKGADFSPLAKLPKLQSLSLRYCKIDDHAIAEIAKVKSLIYLDLTGAHIGDHALILLSKLPNLRIVFLAGCERVTPGGVRVLSLAAPNLQVQASVPYTKPQNLEAHFDDRDLKKLVNDGATQIDAAGWSISDEGLESLVGRPIVSLSLSQTSRITDAGIRNVARLNKLQKLDLTKVSGITDGALLEIAKIKSLKILILNDQTQFSDRAIAAMSQRLPNLRELFANSTRVSSQSCLAFSKMKKLTVLALENCKLVDADLVNLSKIQTLNCLFVNGEGSFITKRGLLVLDRLPALTLLRVSIPPADAETIRFLKMKGNRVIEGIAGPHVIDLKPGKKV